MPIRPGPATPSLPMNAPDRRGEAREVGAMHTMKKRATRLALAGLAILTAATLAACGSDTANPSPSPAQPAQAAPAATTQPTGRPAAGPATTSPGSDFGFIRSWTAKTGTIYLRFDRAVLLTGKA